MAKLTPRPVKNKSKREALNVLLYDDVKSYRELLRTMLTQSPDVKFNIRLAGNPKQMNNELAHHAPDLVVLDLDLKGKSGMEWLVEINKSKIAPVVIVTGSGNEQTAVEAMKKGAFDYIPKAYLTYEQFIKSLTNAWDKWNLMKERQRLQEELAHMAMYDALTDILSRRAVLEQAEAERLRTKRYRRELSLLMIDIDHFKQVNDTHGHITGDIVLREVAQNLKHQIRRSDFIGRYGGEEFLIILPETGLNRALTLAEKLRKRIEGLTIPADGDILKGVTVSVGVSTYDNDSTIDEFINRSDKWLYAAKENGRNQVQPQPDSVD